ncbi:hypothetical protein [Peribacillus deserti]|uniref:Uncharacterized protein n=1 Tax=Peribacillus deserti TaxID=673318 RepID=A0A2N5M715_9BACI|nr:hypothetical protein [Peribacillus deserti]PLT30159.1 hypothetical protein CUU66_08950 [Peribacillus deserti]
MQKLKNESGTALVTVMLVFLIFTVLGITLMSITIGGTKRTEVRETEITGNLESIKAVKEGTSLVQAYVDKYEAELVSKDVTHFNSKFKSDIIQEINGRDLPFKVNDLSETYKNQIGTNSFTKVLEVSSDAHRQKVYITAMPSFLKYALGSRSSLTINGSPILEGNLYSSGPLQISRDANYKYESKYFTVSTDLPSMKDPVNSRVTVEADSINLCKSPGCYTPTSAGWDKNESSWTSISPGQIQDAFSPHAPVYESDKSNFVDVDIPKTFLDKLIECGYNPAPFGESFTDTQKISALKDAVAANPVPGDISVITNFRNLKDYPNTKGFIYKGNAKIDTDALEINSNQWMIIDGDAAIESSLLNRMDVKANILITGNLVISGHVTFNSVIYALGDTTLMNVNISCYKDSCKDQDQNNNEDTVLILITQGNLQISRINSFLDVLQKNTNKIKGYLYTASKADIFAVGSLLNVEGGVFSNEDLVVNSYRGDAKGGTADLSFTAHTEAEDSRLTISNNKRLFLNQLQGLPRVNGLEVIPEILEKTNKKAEP